MKSQFVLLTFFCFYATNAMSEPNLEYKYNPEKGGCFNSEGKNGFNSLVPAQLFIRDNTTGRNDISFVERNAECIDFSGFNAFKYFHTSGFFGYANLKNWNLRGARFDDANFSFTIIRNAALEGAIFDKMKMGYTMIDGTIDAHSQVHRSCQITDLKANCIQ